MKKFLHKLTMGNCSQLLILEARGIMGAIEILGQIDYMDVIGIPRHLQSNGHLLALPSPLPIFPRNSTRVQNTEIKISPQKNIFIWRLTAWDVTEAGMDLTLARKINQTLNWWMTEVGEMMLLKFERGNSQYFSLASIKIKWYKRNPTDVASYGVA